MQGWLSRSAGLGKGEPDFGSWRSLLGLPLLGAGVALLLGALLIPLAGHNPFLAYGVMLQGAFGSQRSLTETALRATPLLIMGLGLTIAFRCKVWNIGAEGQYHLGALAGAVVALNMAEQPAWLVLPLMLLAGIAGGLLWSGLAGWLHLKRGMNLIIVTLMLNYIGILWVRYMARSPLRDPRGFLPESAQFAAVARLPRLLDTRLHLGVVVAVLLVGILYVLLWRTPLGFQLRAVGSRASVARTMGIPVERTIWIALLISGALAGLAGIIEVSTTITRLKGTISDHYGFSAILVALLGQLQPLGVLVAAFLFSALNIGAEALQVRMQIPAAVAQVIQALVVLLVLAGDALARNQGNR
ncbi:ABC transporter permease [Synechococcus sp. Nb3U1]|uniref:ABC transporter permease n=1 Tax=Synechococcus sp. Nb3U1 TaxID=1914529 RepID=UPI001F239590|nr:ABC transporter permease [Synechococcus sp. Nb3U1]MCF2969900.1 ABC transporter permease [Synechococcus sp. Nb3U1]